MTHKPPRTGFVDEKTGKETDMKVVEEAGVAFDPTTTHLDLSKEEKRRTTALMLAIQGYKELIIKDADYLREAHAQARVNAGPQIRPATIDGMVMAALRFDAFIAGNLKWQKELDVDDGRSSHSEIQEPETK